MTWLWPYPEVWSWTPRGPAGTPSSVPVDTALRPTHPAALRTPSHHKCQTMIISQWLATRSLSSSSLTLTSPPPSPETATSVSPTDACSRPNGRPPQPASPAHSLLTLDKGCTTQGPIPPHLSTQELIHPLPLGHIPKPLQVHTAHIWAMVQSSSPLELPQSAAPPPRNHPPAAQAPLWEQAPFPYVLLSCQ